MEQAIYIASNGFPTHPGFGSRIIFSHRLYRVFVGCMHSVKTENNAATEPG